jgi:transposase
MAHRHELTDEQWKAIEPHLPKTAGRKGCNKREFLNAVSWIAKSGASWRDLPARFGNWNTVYHRFAYWCEKGVFEKVFKAVQLPDFEEIMIDSTSCKAHQASAGALKKRVLNALEFQEVA